MSPRFHCPALFLCAALSGSSARADAPSGRYTFTSTAVLDTRTSLTWQRITPADRYSNPNAKTYCATLNLGGVGPWRLPTLKELLSIVDHSTPSAPRIDGAAFPATQPTYYWSATPRSASPTQAWAVNFGHGSSSTWVPGQNYYVRCVR